MPFSTRFRDKRKWTTLSGVSLLCQLLQLAWRSVMLAPRQSMEALIWTRWFGTGDNNLMKSLNKTACVRSDTLKTSRVGMLTFGKQPVSSQRKSYLTRWTQERAEEMGPISNTRLLARPMEAFIMMMIFSQSSLE